MPEGYGQFIAGIGFSGGSRRFDKGGRPMPTPAYRKLEASGYLEYGFRPWLSVIAAPTLAHEHDAPAANTVTGSSSSAFGARVMLYGTPGRVLAVQALVQPPLRDESRASRLADGGARSLATDLRLLIGQGFDAFGFPAFVDIEPGARVRADPLPTEARLDVTLGVRPRPYLLAMLQTFSSFAPSAGPSIDRYSYTKLQGKPRLRRLEELVGSGRIIPNHLRP